MVLALFLQIGFILIDRGIVLINSNKIKEIKEEDKDILSAGWIFYFPSGF